MKTRVELLAPAGSMEALHGALVAGADAVYLGLESFNARRSADNFTLETLEVACEYAHLRGASVYVTMNTVIFPDEIKEALECVRQAYRLGADGFIVQDIGLASEIVRTLPDASLHLSTQMNIHSLAGIRAAARLGARRVTLARELSLDEIALLAQAAEEQAMEVEVFAHGALCVCYSGQCLMSSMIGGRSANRGLCAQACRLPYELRNTALRKDLPSPGDHLLSPKDLCTIDQVESLVSAGVSSLKIEGRMKSPEYVYAVCAVYRKELDRVLALRNSSAERFVGFQGQGVTQKDRDRLTDAFSRGFTTAYLEGNRSNAIMSYQRPNNRGLALGRVDKVCDRRAYLRTKIDVVSGDVLEFWTRKGNSTVTLGSIEHDSKGRLMVPLDQKAHTVREGDRVFRVRSAAAAFQDDERSPRIPLVGHVRLRIGEPLAISFSLATPDEVIESAQDHLGDATRCRLAIARRLACAFPDNGLEGQAIGDPVEPARTRALSVEDVKAHVDRLGATPFDLLRLSVDLDEGVGLGFSTLHNLRSRALNGLTEALLAPWKSRALPKVAVRPVLPAIHPAGCRVAAVVTNPACARAAKRAGAHLIYVPALNYRRGEAVIAGQLNSAVEQAGYPKGCIPFISAIDHEAVGASREALTGIDVWKYASAGKPLLVDSLGALQLASEQDTLVEVGSHLPITNALSLAVAAEFGASRVWLSPELTLRQIETLAKDAPVELGVQIIGAVELMVTEHCLLMSQGSCDEACATCPRRKSPHYLKDRKGFEFPVITDVLGRSHLYNSVPLDVASALPELLAAGISDFLVDTTLMTTEQTAHNVGRALRALHVAQADGNAIAKMPNTTSGHLYRGVA